MTWTFVKHERQNAANAAAKRDGKRVINDFFVMRDGVHVAWWVRSGNGYYLCDLYHEVIHQPPSDRGARKGIIAWSQSQFVPLLDEHADKIPTMDQLRLRREQREEAKRRGEEWAAKDRIENPSHYL